MLIPVSSAMQNTVAAGGDPSYFTGGTVTVDGGYRYHTFNTSGTLTFVDVSGPLDVDYLVVAGGGGGQASANNRSAAGGGAGGMLTASVYALSATQTITVGAGGGSSTNGSASSLGSVATATGGGAGGGGDGGSGGGEAYNTASPGDNPGLGIAGQGFNGGDRSATGSNFVTRPGGGGGASEVGVSGDETIPAYGDGGDGLEWPSGSSTYYAGGGAATFGLGGLGGGADGGSPGTPPVAATANTGGGGGAGRESVSSVPGSAGGSGVVIVRYEDHPSYPAV